MMPGVGKIRASLPVTQYLSSDQKRWIMAYATAMACNVRSLLTSSNSRLSRIIRTEALDQKIAESTYQQR
jgi:hypothetical protein